MKLDWLLAAALLLRALIPAGFMPVSLASGLLLDLCPASNPGWVMAAGMHAAFHPHAGMKHDPKAGEPPKLIDVGADKCIPCIKMAPILDQLREDFAG